MGENLLGFTTRLPWTEIRRNAEKDAEDEKRREGTGVDGPHRPRPRGRLRSISANIVASGRVEQGNGAPQPEDGGPTGVPWDVDWASSRFPLSAHSSLLLRRHVAMSLDHLVIAADTLEQGVRWAEATLGVTPAPGGSHPKDGSHNRLLSLSGTRFPQVYLEIIALEPGSTPIRTPNFDLTDPALQARLRDGPRLVAWVARTATAIEDTVQRLDGLSPPVQVGEVLPFQRGTLTWKLSGRTDGKRLFDGVFPRLIQWPPSTPHPATTLPPSGIELVEFQATHPDQHVGEALQAAGLDGVLTTSAGPADLIATLRTPKGLVTLHSASP